MSEGARAAVTAVPLRRAPGAATVGLLAGVGAAAAWLLASAPPQHSGAARIASAPVLLGSFDALWVLAAAWPRPYAARHRWLAAAATLAAGLAFHVALAAAAGAGGGHAVAVGSIALAAALGGAFAAGSATYAPALAVALLALPVAGYAFADLARGDGLLLVHASPLVAPVLLARDAASVGPWDGAAAVAALAAVATVSALFGRVPRVAVLALVLTLAAPASASPGRAEPALGGFLREGRPVVVRAPGARRVRAAGGPWAGPSGSRGDEFVLLGARPRGELLAVEIESRDGATHAAEVAVQLLSAAGAWTARLDGAPVGRGEVAVRPVDLPTLAEAWLVFDRVVGEPAGLGSAEAAALASYRAMPRAAPFVPALLPPGPGAFRAAASAAAAAPRLPRDVAHVLTILAGLTVLQALLAGRRTGSPVRAVAWSVAPSLAVSAWLLLGGALPGAVRATALVLDAPGERVVLLRLEAVRDGTVRVEAPAGGLLVPLRWGADDAPLDGTSVGRRAEIRLERGRSALFAVRDVPSGEPGTAGRGRPAGRTAALVEDWLRQDGWRARSAAGLESLGGLRLEGARLLGVERVVLDAVR